MQMSLLPRTPLPWTFCHQTTLWPHEAIHEIKWIIWQIQWGTQYSPSLGWITRSILATSGLTCPLGTCHPPTTITSHPKTYIEELTQLTDRLHHLTMTLQPHPAPSLKKNLYTQLCKHTQTPGMPHRKKRYPQANLTTFLLQDIPTFNGQD